MRLVLFTLFVMIPVALADVEPKDSKIVAREIKVKLPGARGRFAKPTKITSKEELEKAIAAKDTREQIAKQVNFKKEYLLLFQWAGSGGDKLTMKVDKGQATFTRTLGRTRDLRTHSRLYALPAKMEYKLGK